MFKLMSLVIPTLGAITICVYQILLSLGLSGHLEEENMVTIVSNGRRVRTLTHGVTTIYVTSNVNCILVLHLRITRNLKIAAFTVMFTIHIQTKL